MGRVMSEHHENIGVVNLRLDNLEESVKVLAAAAADQIEFNASVKAWGRAGLLLYGAGQGALLIVLAYGIQHIGS